jgi:hypothetical protein
MNTEQAFVEGFVKRASEYGYGKNEAEEMLKQSSFDQLSRDIAAGLVKNPRRIAGAGYGLAGAGAGGVVGGAIGGVHNLIDPGTEVDPETGKTVDKSRLTSALVGALKGLGIGAGIGGGIGAGYGLNQANQVIANLKNDPIARRTYRKGLVDLGKEYSKDVRPTTQPVRKLLSSETIYHS